MKKVMDLSIDKMKNVSGGAGCDCSGCSSCSCSNDDQKANTKVKSQVSIDFGKAKNNGWW